MQTQLSEIREALGPPYFEVPGKIILYHEDCLQGMKKLKGKAVDLTVTSPPYNIGKEYETLLPLPDYLKWTNEWVSAVYDLTSPKGAFWLNLGYVDVPGKANAVPLSYLIWQHVPFFLVQEIVWHYGAGVATRHSFSPRNEKFLWYVKNQESYCFNLDAVRDPNVKYPNQKKNGKLKCNPLGKNPSDVWLFPKVTSGTDRASEERTPHPAQFPSAVIDRIVKACSCEGDLILDPFMGSGTTAVVAYCLNRPVFGFEKNEAYLRIAAARIEDLIDRRKIAESQGALFGIEAN